MSQPYAFEQPILRDQRRALRDLLAELSHEEREVILSSGKRSNFYIDCKQVTLHARGGFLIGQLVRAAIEAVAPRAVAVGGLTMGADPIATAVSVVSFLAGRPLHAFLIRKQPKGHGTEQWVEGADNLPAGAPVVILEDVITTGASTLKAIERARGAGLEVAHVIALVDRDEGGRAAIEAQAPVTALFTVRDFTS